MIVYIINIKEGKVKYQEKIPYNIEFPYIFLNSHILKHYDILSENQKKIFSHLTLIMKALLKICLNLQRNVIIAKQKTAQKKKKSQIKRILKIIFIQKFNKIFGF